MQNTERQLILELFERLRGAEGQRRDPEVERLIAEELRRAPHAPYAMAQTIIAQNQALEAAAARVEQLERGEYAEGEFANEPARGAMGAPQLGGRGSVPSFGRGAVAQGGGFLANAGQVAMGVAGGMLVAEAAKSLLGLGSEAQAATADTAAAADTPPTDTPAAADSQLAEDAGAGDIGGAEESGGGGLFGWLFGGGPQDHAGADTNADNDHDMADGGDWGDGGGDGGDFG